MIAKDVMTKNVITVNPEMAVKDLAGLLSEKNIGGAPVVDGNGKLLGIVTESDLVIKDARLHYPTYIHLLDGFIYWPSSVAKFNEEFKKALGATVGEIMTVDAATAREDATIEDLATLMIEKDIGLIPIIDNTGKVMGIVTKHDVVTAIGKSS
ncbi:MAG: CBS domain-containing protein [Actinomycetota bacterium]